MSFYNPLQSQYEKQRLNLEKSIINLQEKLRSRHQNRYEAQFRQHVRQPIIHNKIINRSQLNPIIQGNTYTITNRTRQRQMYPDYLARIQSMKVSLKQPYQHTEQKFNLNNNIYHRYSAANLGQYRGRAIIKQQDQQDLVEKYKNGTKAREYNEELGKFKAINQSITDRKRQQNSINIHHLGATQHHLFQHSQSNQKYNTPYDRLVKMDKLTDSQSKHRVKKVKQNLKDKFMNEPENIFAQVESKGIKIKGNSNLGSKEEELVENFKYAQLKENNSYLDSNKLQKGNVSHTKLWKQTDNSFKNHEIQKMNSKTNISTNAGKKIENRLKLSQIIFEDCKFKNIKYEQKHLYMTYENELKVRKQIKQKLNHHPSILRKHALVI